MEVVMAKIRRRVELADLAYAKWEKADRRAALKKPRGKKSSQRAVFERSAEWVVAREECLQRLGRACLLCGSTEKINVDHIKPKSRYPELALEQSNLRPLCWPCNRRKAARDA